MFFYKSYYFIKRENFKDKTPLENGETSCSACLFCDKQLKAVIEAYLKSANKRLDHDFKHGSSFRPRRGGHRGGRGGRRGKRRDPKDW